MVLVKMFGSNDFYHNSKIVELTNQGRLEEFNQAKHNRFAAYTLGKQYV